MGWAVGYDSDWNRDIGYGVPATCDHPGCGEKIDRGLSFVCGGEPYGGDHGCGLYFCSKHLLIYKTPRGAGRLVQQCVRCDRYRPPFKPTPDHPEWTAHKLTDPSWQQWRDENPDVVEASRAALEQTP